MQFKCQVCGKHFEVSEAVLRKYPQWQPRYCREHSPRKKKQVSQTCGAAKAGSAPGGAAELLLPVAEVLKRYTEGPQTGVFTDGSARPNPGPGGWGVVRVQDGKVITQRYGHEENTTNNRMELTALINAYRLLGPDENADIFCDSELCVKTINEWAPVWEKRGWKRKGGPIMNLELVRELYALAKDHPQVKIRWIEAHNGWLWNEYADSLATAWTREQL